MCGRGGGGGAKGISGRGSSFIKDQNDTTLKRTESVLSLFSSSETLKDT